MEWNGMKIYPYSPSKKNPVLQKSSLPFLDPKKCDFLAICISYSCQNNREAIL